MSESNRPSANGKNSDSKHGNSDPSSSDIGFSRVLPESIRNYEYQHGEPLMNTAEEAYQILKNSVLKDGQA
jgi:hypothetical protein